MGFRFATLTAVLVAFLVGPNADALCIACGCQRVYDLCIDGEGKVPNPLGGLTDYCQTHSGPIADCCRDVRRDCHGTGIRISISGLFGITFEAATVQSALSPFDSPASDEVRDRMSMLDNAVEALDQEEVAVHTAVLNAVTPLLNEEERAAVMAAFEVEPFSWTEWQDRDDPSGSGDWETLNSFIRQGVTCSEPVGIECRTLDGVDWRQTGQVYQCDPSAGGICQNRQQPAGERCHDYEVRFLCRSPGD